MAVFAGAGLQPVPYCPFLTGSWLRYEPAVGMSGDHVDNRQFHYPSFAAPYAVTKKKDVSLR
jgi:hypothetical protein